MASRMWAAMTLALSMTFSAALTTAMPPTTSDREPVSRPRGEVWVSPCSTSTSSNATPSLSATIWLHAVSCPCPWALAPVITSTLPVGSIRIEAVSQPPAA